MLLEIEVFDNPTREGSAKMGAGAVFETRIDFIADGDAARESPPLEDQDSFPGLGEISRADKPIMAGTDNDGVEFSHGSPRHSFCL